MKTTARLSWPVLAFGIVTLIFTLLAAWFGLRYRSQSATVESERVVAQSSEPAGSAPDSIPPTASVLAPSGNLPPVIPISLIGVIEENENNVLREESQMQLLPHGTQTFGSIEFWIDGMVHLQGRSTAVDKHKNYRTNVFVSLTVTNFADGQTDVQQLASNVGCLYLLGATRFSAGAGTTFASVVWHYADGSVRRTPIKYGVHLRDWLRRRFEEPAQLSFPFTKVAWRGAYPSRADRSLRLYRLTLANPQPSKVVSGIEFASSMERPALFFLALTLDPLKPGERPDDLSGEEETDPEPDGRIQLIVQDSQGWPVVRATVNVAVFESGSGGANFRRKAESDRSGTAMLSFPDDNGVRLEVGASHEDYGSRKMVWDKQAGDIIPATYTIKLGDGVSIGGMVVDENDSPVADAQIRLYRFWSGGDEMNKKGEQADFPNQTKTTDALGRWQAKGLPADLLDRISLNVTHPDFVQTNFTVGENAVVEAKLRDETHKLVLQRGTIVRGRVVDESDKPIAGAQVWAGMVNYSGTQNTRTDAHGAFDFRNLKEGEMQFSVLAKGRKPEVRKISVKPGMDEILFKLGPGNIIRGVVKDESGALVQGVRIALESPSGGVSHEYQFEMNSDSDGRFEWDGAPDEAKNFCFLKTGYEAKRRQTLKPNEENVVTLRKGRQVQGWVLDAESEKPITRFRVGVGQYNVSIDQFHADYPGMKEYSDANGMFTLQVNEEQINGIKAEADDYAEQVERMPEAENGIVEMVLRLKPSAALRGIVVSSDGMPVSGAAVASTGGSGVSWVTRASLKNGRIVSMGSQSKIVTTDASGQFTLPSPPGEGSSVIASAEMGFASASVEQVRASGRLILQSFGRIEGTFKIGGQPVAGQEFMFSMVNKGLWTDSDTYKSSTDAEGRFSINKIPPGEGQIVRLVRTDPNTRMHSHQTPVLIEPGRTTTITLGNAGAVLKGHVSFETPLAEDEQLTISGSLNSVRRDPSRVFQNAEEARAFYESAEGKAETAQMKHFGVSVNADGSLALDSIPPGNYTLNISASKAGSQPWESQPVASGQTTVTVPANANPYSPITIGEIVLKPTPKQ